MKKVKNTIQHASADPEIELYARLLNFLTAYSAYALDVFRPDNPHVKHMPGGHPTSLKL